MVTTTQLKITDVMSSSSGFFPRSKIGVHTTKAITKRVNSALRMFLP
jgi:hypothetical protein